MTRFSDHGGLRDPETGKLDPNEFKYRLKGALAVILAIVVLVGGGLFVGFKAYGWYMDKKTVDDFPGPGHGEVTVVIPPNTTVSGIGKILTEAKVVKSAKAFQSAASIRAAEANRLQAGKFRLMMEIPASTALTQLLDPDRQVRTWMQLKDGQRLTLAAPTIAAATNTDPATVMKYLSTTPPSELGIPNWGPKMASEVAAQGFLFPEKYEVPDGAKVSDMVKRSVSQFNKVTKKLEFESKAQELNFSDPNDTPATKAYKAVIVASIIDREVMRAEDRPKVARVLYNRLAKGMPLQLDSTVSYAVNKNDEVFTTDAERASNSPYNTYKVTGLPPTPILSPSEAALAAAINPEEGNWLFFTAVNLVSGETAFSVDKAEHDANVAKLQAWCKSDEGKGKCR